jgi:hypothetical protein
MARRTNVVATSAALLALVSGTVAMTPVSATIADANGFGTTSATPEYVQSFVDSKAVLKQILTAGDSVPSSGYKLPGIPDGSGVVKNADGTTTLYLNHELSASDPYTMRTERLAGQNASTISKITLSAAGTVTAFEDAIKKISWYDYQDKAWDITGPSAPDLAPETDSYATPNHSNALNRFCSATLVLGDLATSVREPVTTQEYVTRVVTIKKKKVTQWQNNAGKWSTTKVKRNVTRTVTSTYGWANPVFLTSEEGNDESRTFGLETKTGELVQLPAFGLGGMENTNIADSAATGKTTIAIAGEDGAATDSQLFLYKGTKTKTGTWAARAGLTNGLRYVARATQSVPTVSSNVITGSSLGILANDVKVREALAVKTVSSVKSGANAQVTAVSVAVDGGGAFKVTIASGDQKFKVGDHVTISGFDSADSAIAAAVATGNTGAITNDAVNGDQIVTAISSTSFTFNVDSDATIATTAFTGLKADAASGDTFVKTSAASGVTEGDTVVFAGFTAGDAVLNGKFEVTGTPLDTVFSIHPTGAAVARNLAPTGVTVNKTIDIDFRKVPTVANDGDALSGDAQQTVAALRGTEFARVEDAQFDPTDANVFYFVTTQSDSDGVSTPASGAGNYGVKEANRDGGAIWKLTFKNVADPSLGASLELVLNGTEIPSNDAASGNTGGALFKPDNISVSVVGGERYMFIQEDPGGVDRISRLLALRLSDKKLVTVAKFNADMFDPAGNASGYLTNDEETSGIIDVTSALGAPAGAQADGATFIFDAQVHPLAAAGGVSYSDGTAGANLPLQARSAALLRSDLNPQNTLAVQPTGVVLNAVASSARTMTISLDSAVEVVDGEFATTGTNQNLTVGVNDVVTLRGVNSTLNGTYLVKAIDTTAKTITIAVSATATLTGTTSGTPTIVATNTDSDNSFKESILEGGAVYKMSIPSLAGLFE